ncbi:hypothetical protein BsWGS_07249 [Bradybaena similaris]
MTGMKAAIDNILKRPLMSYQPARTVLLDMAHPFEVQAGRCLCDALENTLCISANMSGPTRIPLISIYVLASYPENVLPLTCTKGNFVRLHSALVDVRTFLDESLQQHQSKEQESCIPQGMLEACKQYKRYIENLAQAALVFKQLELIVFTGQPGNLVQKQIETLTEQIDFSIIKRIVSVTINCGLVASATQDSPDIPVFDTISDEFSGLVDVITLECDPLSQQKFFYTWLMDSSSECEHLHLLLPAPNPTEEDLVIKCDFVERMLSPTQLPCCDAFDLHVESNVCKHVFPTSSKAVGMSVPVQQLKIIRCLPRATLCESVLFGLPLILTPTACWKIEWEVLERNQQNFISLCNELFTKDQILVAQLVVTSLKAQNYEWPLTRPGAAHGSPAPKPAGYFVLMPSEHRSMLVKSVLSRELLLPSSHAMVSGMPTAESDQRVQASLSQVDIGDSFNPLHYEAGLHAALKHASLPKSAVDKARTLKRKIGLPQSKSDWGFSCNPSSQKITEKSNRLVFSGWSTALPGNVK